MWAQQRRHAGQQSAVEMNLNKAEKRQQRWLDACRRGRAEEVQQLILEGADVSERNYGETVLISAAQYGHYRVVKILLDAGAEVEAVCRGPGSESYTALRWAVIGGHEKVARILLDAGAEVEECSNDRSTALIDAAERGHVGVAQMLLDAGADTISTGWDNQSGTALHLAAKKRNPAMVMMLLDNGAAVNVKNTQKERPLHLGAQHCASGSNVEVVLILLDAGADIAAIDSYGQSALARASAVLATSLPYQTERISYCKATGEVSISLDTTLLCPFDEFWS
ncbi:ankyrin repeat-containing domain protein, partial [Baffinella frigidus]